MKARQGFGLIVIVITVAVVATLGAVIAVNMRGFEDERRVQETVEDLLLLEAALPKVVRAATRYPMQISHLATVPTTADKNSCGINWTSGWISNWQNRFPFGPFYTKRIIPLQTGFPLGIGVALDTMVRVPPTSTGSGTLRIRIPDVSESDVIHIDEAIDAANGRTTGKVQWTVPANGRVDTLNFIHTRTSNNC